MFLVILLSQFLREFIEIGLHNGPPLFGDDFSQLAGVILFNFAYSITVPAWLMEKKTHVSVNRTVWSAGILSSILYIAFGLLGAMSFQQVGPNLLVLLASKKVSLFLFFSFLLSNSSISL